MLNYKINVHMKHTNVYACFFYRQRNFIHHKDKKLRSVQYEKKRIERASTNAQYPPHTATRNFHPTPQSIFSPWLMKLFFF